MAKAEEEKKSDSPSRSKINQQEETKDPPSAPTSDFSISLGPRSSNLEQYLEGSALEELLSSQANVGDTVKAKNTSRENQHLRGLSWDRRVPDAHDATNQSNMLSTSDTDTSKPAASAGGKPTSARGGTSNRNMIPRPPFVFGSKCSNNDSSLGSSQSDVSSRCEALEKPSNVDVEVVKILNEVCANEVNAETSLMRNLDEKDPLRPRAGTGASILSEVPIDEVEHNFVIEDDDGLVLSSSKLKKAGSNLSEREPSVKRQSDRIAPSSPAKTHNRHMTVEQALFGLTTALTELKANDQMDRPECGGHERIDTIGSNDIFETAGMLFDRANKKIVPAKEPVEENEEASRPRLGSKESNSKQKTTAGGRWEAIKKNLDVGPDVDPSDVGPKGSDIEEGPNQDININYSEDSRDNSDDNQGKTSKNQRPSWMTKSKKVNPFLHLPYANKVKEEWDVFNKFLNPRKQSLRIYIKIILLYIMIPATSIAAILFYLTNNPPYGYCPTNGCEPRLPYPSASWWIVFIGCRQVVIACLSKLTEAIVIDFFALRTQVTLRVLGPMFTLLLVQSRGWPFLIFCFGMYNFLLVQGESPFSNHWLYWQPYIGMFNRSNPSGIVTSSLAFSRVCAVAMSVGAAVAVKRMALGIYLGRKTFANYAKRLTSAMNKMLMLNELARLGRALEEQTLTTSKRRSLNGRVSKVADERLLELLDIANQQPDDDSLTFSLGKSSPMSSEKETIDEMDKVIDPSDIDPYTGSLSFHQKNKISDLLGQWEEPVRESTSVVDEVASVGAVMQFKRALAHMDTDFPFGGKFGIADTRESCIACSQKLYARLMVKESGLSSMLHFNTIAVLGRERNGNLNTEKTKDLIRIFRPDRDGAISLVDFVRSIDNVYKELRLLRATVAGSTKIDKALESIFNYVFYIVLACVILWILDIDPLKLFLSLSSIVLAFAFMIGSASSKYFEGLLLIVVQRPYGIGDRINVSNPEVPGDTGGSQGWIVEDVTLFTTTMYLAATSERATVSNGMLAQSRIINCARSPNAIVYVVMRFGIETPYRKVELFKRTVEKFVRSKPRQWSSMLSFLVCRIEADLGFIEYTTGLRHREAWQNIVPILNSRNVMHAFCLELAKKLDMRYKSPPLPVDLRIHGQIPPQFDFKFNNEDLSGERMGDGTAHQVAYPTRSPSHSWNSDSFAQVAAMFD